MVIAIPDDYQNVIRSLDCFKLIADQDVRVYHDYLFDEPTIAERFKDAEAIVLNRTRTKLTRSLLEQLPNLKVISQTGKNAGHIDAAACRELNISIIEGYGNPISTAELTWALIMNGLRQIPQAIQGMKAGNWQTNLGSRVAMKTIGIWGYGKIGKKIATYAKAFDAYPLIWGSEDSLSNAKSDGYEVADSRDEFFRISDVVSLHLRLKESTTEIVKYNDLIQMKKQALFVNTSRAGLIESGALLRALNEGTPGFAALDVYDEEPILTMDHPFLQMDNVICTPHLGYVEKANYELYFGTAFKNLMEWMATS